MPSEMLKNAIALIYRKKGKEILSEKELQLVITMDFRWFTPQESETLIDLALKSNLILKHKNGLKINFDHHKREIPLDFQPTTAVFEEAAHKSCFVAIVETIQEHDDLSREDIIAEINEKQKTFNVAIEVAALLVAASHGIDISNYYDLVESDLLTRFGPKVNN